MCRIAPKPSKTPSTSISSLLAAKIGFAKKTPTSAVARRRNNSHMDFGLKGRIAIVAAASKGLGRAVAEELAKEGCEVAICARTAPDVERTAQEIGATAGREIFWRALDVTNADGVRDFVAAVEKKFG